MHPHDERWFNQMVAKLPPAARQKAVDGYAQAYKEAYDAAFCINEYAREDAARYAANTRLRLFVELVTGERV